MGMLQPHKVLRVKSHFHPAAVYRVGDVVVPDSGPWTRTVHALLRHLEEVGFEAAPRVVGSGFDANGREMLTFIQRDFIHPGPWHSMERSRSARSFLNGVRRLFWRVKCTFRPNSLACSTRQRARLTRGLGDHVFAPA